MTETVRMDLAIDLHGWHDVRLHVQHDKGEAATGCRFTECAQLDPRAVERINACPAPHHEIPPQHATNVHLGLEPSLNEVQMKDFRSLFLSKSNKQHYIPDKHTSYYLKTIPNTNKQ